MPTFSELVATQMRKLVHWVKPDPSDVVGVRIVKTFFKSIAMLLLLLFSPVLLIGLAVAFFGPM